MKPEKLNFSKIEKFDLEDISTLLDAKSISNINDQLEDILGNDTDLVEVKLNYNSAWDRKSNGLTPDARKRYMEADKSYFKFTNTNMTIHISKLDVYKQAELYIKHKYYGEGQRASWPGCSFHNWGLAVDMAHADYDVLKQAMNEQGWTQPDEQTPWHFECSGSRDYEKAAKVIKSFRNSKSGLAFKWSEQVACFYNKREILNKRVPIFNKRLEDNKSFTQILLSEIDSFNIDSQGVKSRANRFNKDITKYNLEFSKAEKLNAEIISMPDDQPNTQKMTAYKRICNWLEMEFLRINDETRNIESENHLLLERSVELQRKISECARQLNWLAEENKILEKLAKEIEQHKSAATLHLMNIDSQTWK
ncbi:MAG: M15 family metallopeptidase [Bacteroidales bacterium]